MTPIKSPQTETPTLSGKASGIALINKPEGVTSFDCVRALKKAWQRTDLGHGGTLDRFASGLLVILAGEGLKLSRFFLEDHPDLSTHWKIYRARLQLGYETDTGDPTGSMKEQAAVPSQLSEQQIQDAMNSFVGNIYRQRPPVYSAKKVQGQRASDLARAGQAPELSEVSVDIRHFSHLNSNLKPPQTIDFDVTCSKGTYIRVLGEDLARKLETRGHLQMLHRRGIGQFSVEHAFHLEDARNRKDTDVLIPLKQATEFIPSILLNSTQAEDLRCGRTQDLLAELSTRKPGVYLYRNQNHEPLAVAQCFEASQSECSEKELVSARILRAFVTA